MTVRGRAVHRGEPATSALSFSREPVRVNDFTISIATVNGTGSQTANLILTRAIFKMGVPVNAKNIFPSNIQGQPTWFRIRLSEEGYIAYRNEYEVLVAFNRQTMREDVEHLSPGGLCIYPKEWQDSDLRDDVTYRPLPLNAILRDAGIGGKIREYLGNMVYIGALSYLLGVDITKIREALTFNFADRPDAIEQNMVVVTTAYDWQSRHANGSSTYRLVQRKPFNDKFLITGNEAAALGAVFGGVTFASWYPITPSTSLIDALNRFLPGLRTDPDTGKPTYVVLQAEDELAAAGMIIGAGWAGARSMTATSGPGISLMSEFVSLAYFAEVPAVIWDIQRVGPSTGLPTRTSQGDIQFAYNLGHGDTKNVLLLPATVEECFEFGTVAHNLAEELQTPVLVMSDLDLGMNTWMSKRFDYPEPIRRGKVLGEDDLENVVFGRWADVDGDGISYRTLPGNRNPKGVYFNRGTGHSAAGYYSEKPEDLRYVMAKLLTKLETARDRVPNPIIDMGDDCQVGIVAYGSTLPAIDEARDRLKEIGVKTNFLRLRALPINDDVSQFIQAHDRIYVVELNRDGQMAQILAAELPSLAPRLRSLSTIDGLPMTVDWLVGRLMEKEGFEQGKEPKN